MKPHRSAVVGPIFLQQENWRRAIWDFCNNIGTWRLSLRCTKFRRDRRYADIDRPPASFASEAYDPDCVKTPRGITAPGILGSMVMRRTKKRKNLSSARHHDQIRFRFHTTKTHQRHWLCTAAKWF